MHTFGEAYVPAVALPILASSGNRTGNTIDVKNHRGVAFLLDIGTAPASTVHDLTFEASDDGTTWFTLDGLGYAIRPGSPAQSIFDIARPKNRYIRLKVVGDGARVVTLSATAFKYGGPSLPVAYPGGGVAPYLWSKRSPLPAA